MTGNLTKRDIILDIYKKSEVPQRDIQEVVQLTLDRIAEALGQGQDVELRKIGTFRIEVRKSRIGRNPKQPKKIVMIPRRLVVKFKPGKIIKRQLKQIKVN